MPSEAIRRQAECDVLVIGSGAGGLSAAITAAWHGLEVIIAEKEPVYGGTTAWSGGWMWIPRNPLAQRAGILEDPEQVRTYLRHDLGNRYDPARIGRTAGELLMSRLAGDGGSPHLVELPVTLIPRGSAEFPPADLTAGVRGFSR